MRSDFRLFYLQCFANRRILLPICLHEQSLNELARTDLKVLGLNFSAGLLSLETEPFGQLGLLQNRSTACNGLLAAVACCSTTLLDLHQDRWTNLAASS